MFVTIHAAVGALLARAARTERLVPLAAAGIASHFLCDAIPHWGAGPDVELTDPRFLRVAVPDGLATLALLAALGSGPPTRRRLAVVVTAAAAVAPDLDKPLELLLGRDPYPAWLSRFHSRIQREKPGYLVRDVALAGALASLARWGTRDTAGTPS